MQKLLTILNFLNILDSEGRLSITNLGLICLLIKVMISPDADWSSIVAIVVAFANYMHKREKITLPSGEEK